MGRLNHDALELDLQRRLPGFTVVVSHLDVMQALDAGFFHLGRNRMATVAGEPIDAGANEEVRAELLRQAVQLVNVALPVADMHAAPRLSEALDRLSEILEPAHALLLLDWNAGRVDLFLSAAVPLNFFRVQNFTAANPSGSPWVVTARLECISIPQTV
jgi:hypothetical protein